MTGLVVRLAPPDLSGKLPQDLGLRVNRYPIWWAVRSPALQAGLSGGDASWCGNLKRVRPLVARICHCSTELPALGG